MSTILHGYHIVVWSVGLVITLYILKQELSQRRRKNKSPLFTSKYLALFSLSALICCSLVCVAQLLFTTPNICWYAWSFATILLGFACLSFTFYKLARLYYSFSQSQCHTNNGYSNKLFIILYSIGIIMALCECTLSWWSVPRTYETMTLCHTEFTNYFWVTPGLASMYIVWDLFVVSLYYYKIHQFNKLNATNQGIDIISKRIAFILNKILFLTLGTEMLVIAICGGLYILTVTRSIVYVQILADFGLMGSIVEMALVVYLMMEHNLSAYLKLLEIIDRTKCYCCCYTIIDNARPHMDNIDVKVSEPDSIQVTNTQNEIQTRVERLKTYQSEYTQTQLD